MEPTAITNNQTENQPAWWEEEVGVKISEIKKIQETDQLEKFKTIKRLLLEAMDIIRREATTTYRESISPNQPFDPQQAGSSRESAAQEFDSLSRQITREAKNFARSTFDPGKLLLEYYAAYNDLLAGCPERTPEISFPEWDETNRGAYSCPVLDEKNRGIQELLSSQSATFITLRFPRDWKHFLSGGPLITYQFNPQRTYLGAGGNIEMLVPLKPGSSSIHMGGEIIFAAQVGFDHPNVFEGEPKTVEGVFMPVLFEVGIKGSSQTVLLQGGGWFTQSDLFDAEQEKDPYAQSAWDNLALRLGVKVYLAKNHIRLAGGYQHNPWGPSGYLEVGYRLGE